VETFGFAEAPDGARLWWEWVPTSRAPGDAPTLLLLNGANCTTHYWPPLVRAFCRNLSILQWDYRGHGRSDRDVAPETASVEVFAEDARAVLDAARVSRVVLVGHSLGVMVSLELWRQAPDRVLALAPMFGSSGGPPVSLKEIERASSLIDKALYGLGQALRPVREPFARLLQTRFGLFLAAQLGANADLLPGGYLRLLMEHIETMDPALALECYRSALRYDGASFLPEIEVPTLIFAGAQDRMTPPERAREMAHAIPGAELCVITRGSHLAMLEAPGRVHQALFRFLDRHGLLGAVNG